MRVGALDRRVTIQEQTVTRDSYGGEVVSWVDVRTVWASVSPISAREFVASKQVEGETTVKVLIRWLAGITTSKLRVVLYEPEQGGSPTAQTYLDVIAVLPSTERRRWIQLMCRSGVNNG